MEGRRVFAAEARELDRAERGAIVCAGEEGRKRLEGKKKKKKEEKKSDSRQKRAREEKKKGGGVEKEEAKQERGEREMTGGVEGWRET